MTNPDISPVGFAGTEHPRSTVVRRRGTWWIALGVLLILVGIAGIVRFVVQDRGWTGSLRKRRPTERIG